MDYEPKDVIVLGAIMSGATKFGKISKVTRIPPAELDGILAGLEKRGLIRVEEKDGWFGKKVEMRTTEKGNSEVEHRIHEMRGDWQNLVQLYKSGDKKNLGEQMDGFKGAFPMMMFFGVIDIMMFSMMFSMMGATMGDYIPADQMPDGGDPAAGSEGMDDGGFGLDIGL